jgi:hypothetical protein
MQMQAFTPLNAGANLANSLVFATSTAAAQGQFRTTALGNTSVAAQSATQPNGIYIQNFSGGWLFFNLGQTASLTAAAVPVATSIPCVGIPPNTSAVFCCDPWAQYISAILSTGTGVIVVTLGEGV